MRVSDFAFIWGLGMRGFGFCVYHRAEICRTPSKPPLPTPHPPNKTSTSSPYRKTSTIRSDPRTLNPKSSQILSTAPSFFGSSCAGARSGVSKSLESLVSADLARPYCFESVKLQNVADCERREHTPSCPPPPHSWKPQAVQAVRSHEHGPHRIYHTHS